MNFEHFFNIRREYCLILIDSLNYLIKEHKSKLFAYAVMPSYVHMILYLPEGQSLVDYMRDFKKYTSVEIRKLAERVITHCPVVDSLVKPTPVAGAINIKKTVS